MIHYFSAVGRLCLVALLAMGLGVRLNAQDDTAKPDVPKPEMLTCKVLVLDPDGNPIEDATVFCTGLRTKADPGSHWIWLEQRLGPAPKLKTNEQGIVEMPYPKYVMEKLETGKMTWSVEHSDFVDAREDRSVSDAPAEIQMVRGFRIAVTAVNADTGTQIKNDLHVIIGGAWGDWNLRENGTLTSPVFSKRVCTMRVVQLENGSPSLFSESITIEPGDRSRVFLKNVALSLGTRVEGKIDPSVPRPIRNGQVAVIVKSNVPNVGVRDNWSWYDKASIQEDGSFVFESLPPDEVMQIVLVCDGWISAKPEKATVLKFFLDEERSLNQGVTFPQVIPLKGTRIEPTILMNKATAVKVTVKSPNGNPVEGAVVSMWPNQYWFHGGSQVLGAAYSQREMMITARKGDTGQIKRTIRFLATTDESGVAIIRNLPTNTTELISVGYDDFEMPISGERRVASVNLKPNEVAEITIQMQKKGTAALGDAPDDDK